MSLLGIEQPCDHSIELVLLVLFWNFVITKTL